MKHAALAALFAVSAACFSASYRSPVAFVFVAVAAISTFWTRSLSNAGLKALRRLLAVVLGITILYGWLIMVYPILGDDTVRFWSLGLGYALGLLGALLLVSPSDTLVVPASAALLVVASFDHEAPVHPYLVAAGLIGFVYLAIDTFPSNEVQLSHRLRRLGALVTFACVAIGIGILIVRVLPWAQEHIEETMVTLYGPSSDALSEGSRSRLGELERLKLSRKVVMRVWTERPQRLRTHVLTSFDGTGWYRNASAGREIEPFEGELDLDPEARAFVSGLPGVEFALAPDHVYGQRLIRTKVVRTDGVGLATPGGTYVVRAPADRLRVEPGSVVSLPPDERVRIYGVLHDVNHQRSEENVLDAAMREVTLALPSALDPRTLELSTSLTRDTANDEAAVSRVVTYLRENYEYSLDVGQMDSRDPIADFLFRKRKGWCEYFAGSAAVLLRAAGIPTRYVRGFNVIGSQKKGDHYVVRDWDRHAWIEAYIEGKGWLEYDPTPAAEYETLHASLDDGFFEDLGEWLSAHAATLYAFFRHLPWSRLTSLPGLTSLIRPGAWLLTLATFFYAFKRLRGLRHRRHAAPSSKAESRPELDRLLADLDRVLARWGMPRPRARAPLEHWMSLPPEEIPPPLLEAGARTLRSYYQVRYGGAPFSDEETAALRRALREAARAPVMKRAKRGT